MIEDPRAVTAEQADDDALWFIAPLTITEAMLQTALRRLHCAIDGADWTGQTGKFCE